MKSLNCFIIVVFFLVLFSCKKESDQDFYDPETIKNYKNENIETSKMDSVNAIQLIVKQKLQEVYDLASLWVNNQDDETLDSLLMERLNSYFYDYDSLTLKSLLQELDTLKINRLSVQNINQEKDSLLLDTMGYAKYDLTYFLKNKNILKTDKRKVGFVLKRNESDSTPYFNFYFHEFKSENDTISSGVTQ